MAPEYNLEIQAQIPATLTSIHNFICSHDSDGHAPHTANGGPNHNDSNDEAHPVFTLKEEVDQQWDQIAQAMWDDYWQLCEERGIGTDGSDELNTDDDDEFDKEDN